MNRLPNTRTCDPPLSNPRFSIILSYIRSKNISRLCIGSKITSSSLLLILHDQRTMLLPTTFFSSPVLNNKSEGSLANQSVQHNSTNLPFLAPPSWTLPEPVRVATGAHSHSHPIYQISWPQCHHLNPHFPYFLRLGSPHRQNSTVAVPPTMQKPHNCY